MSFDTISKMFYSVASDAYDKKIFSDEYYLSDSRMDFRGKNPYTFAERVKKHPIQILLHPIHYTKKGLKYPDIFHKFIKRFYPIFTIFPIVYFFS